MSLITIASARSVWRGYEYYKENSVLESVKISDSKIKGIVSGSGNNHYDVLIDIEHPRKSKCNCPHADGRRIVCKHMVALFFNSFTQEANNYYAEVVAYELEEEKRQEELENKIDNYINSLNKNELKLLVYELLYNLPEWQYEEFIRMYIE
ncbi:SWIM zinc finger domain-containing protein [Erysipelotrichaceae bacterium OttesenSCG-928-M19]|nr:SWIM zinc finger domain-containing protein [Erysipelotrichaceae bacterium OttesenSCG-928-M19]